MDGARSAPHTPVPPDRAHVATEGRHPASAGLHRASVAECVSLMQEADREVLDAMAAARPALVALIEDAAVRFRRGGRLVYLGAGTSGRLGVLDASEAPPTFQVEPGRVVGVIAGSDAALRRSSEGLEDDPRGAAGELARLALGPDDTLIGLTSGGTTAYVLGGLEIAKEAAAGPLTALITCAPGARPAFVDHLVVIPTGPEVLTGSTRMKAGTATKMALNTISTALMVASGRVFENLMVDLRATNDKLLDRAIRIVTTLEPGLTRGEARALLDAAGGSVKAAIVMRRRGVGREGAESALAGAGGRLDEVLDRLGAKKGAD